MVYGGVDVKKHLRALKQRMPDILIATPGRCWDIMTQDHVSAWAGGRGRQTGARMLLL